MLRRLNVKGCFFNVTILFKSNVQRPLVGLYSREFKTAELSKMPLFGFTNSIRIGHFTNECNVWSKNASFWKGLVL